MLVGASSADALPPNFEETTAFSGLVNPTVVRFAADGRVLVAEKSGLIKSYSGLGDTTADTVADLRGAVHNFWDRGLLGMALDPGFASNNRVYVLYTREAAPPWGDACPSPPGATTDGCVVSGRLSRLSLNGTPNPPETVLIDDWCQQYPSHSIGSLEFGDDGALYASSGDGASFNFVDYGQAGIPLNPCGDPPAGVGGTQTPPTAEGGALRSQDLRTPTDPTTLDGTVIRVNPATGAGLPSNPNAASSDPNARRIIAQGLRNPFRFAISPDDEIWAGDVGWNNWEELNRMPTDPPSVVNFGWPCYEGVGRQGGYDGADLSICESLYSLGPVSAPAFAYSHSAQVVGGDGCPTGSSSVAGVDFYESGPFPSAYNDALFFADYSRDCIWVIHAGADGRPNPATVASFVPGAANPTFVQAGPDGALYYTDFDGGRVRRITYSISNTSPTAVASANPTSGSAPLTVQFDGSGSSDPDPGETLDYAWDLDGDGAYDDSAAVAPQRTYTAPASFVARLRVTDDDGATGTDSIAIDVDNEPPVPQILTPASGTRWQVDETIAFSGTAADDQGPVPPSGLDWDVIIDHCPSNCHQHPYQSFTGGSGSFPAPDHEYPSSLRLRLTATDALGASATITRQLDPHTVDLTVDSAPAGLEVALNGASQAAPLSKTVIEGSANTIGAPSPQRLGGRWFAWTSWSDGGAATHPIVADASGTYSASFAPIATPGPDPGPAPPPPAEPPPAEPPDLELRTLKLRIPKSPEGLIERGGRAKLRCNLDCRAVVKLIARGRHARLIGIDGTIARAVGELEAETPTWVTALLRNRAERRLLQAPAWLRPQVKARVEAR